MRARSRRILLLVVVLCLFTGAGGLYLRREHLRDAEARSARAEGLAAFTSGDYPLAVLKLSEFIKRLDPDALALMRYAQAILGLPNPDARHLESAIVSLRRSVAKAPSVAEARRALLGLFRKVGMRTEAIEQANWFLLNEPGDEGALLAKASALAEMNLLAEALDVLKDRVGTDSPRLELQLLYVGLMAGLKQPRADILKRAEDVEAANGSDRRFRLVGARARLATDDLPGAQEILKPLVPLAESDHTYAKLLVPALDAAGLSRLSLEVLETFAVKDLEPQMQVDLLKRLWELGQAASIEKHFSSWKLAPSVLPSPVLAYEILALRRLNRADGFVPLLAVLQGRTQDAVAVGWARLITGVVLAESPTVRDRISACLSAIESDANNPQSRFELGLAYRDAGEVELALRALAKAGGLAGNWPEPAAWGARVLAENGELPAAVNAAMAAEQRGSTEPGVALLATMARSARSSVAGSTRPERMLRVVEESGLPPGQTLSVRLALAAASGKADLESKLIEEALRPDAKPEPEVLLACVLLSLKHGLGFDSTSIARFEVLYGSTPALALVLARQAALSEGAGVGKALLRARRSSAKDRDSSAWSAAEAAYSEAFAPQEEALLAWEQTATLAKDEPRRLRAILDASSTWKDLGFARRVIDMLKAATGMSCLWWRYYEARWVLAGVKVDASASDGAITLLQGILDAAPEHVPARLLLAGAYEARGQWQKSLDQLVVARSGRASRVSMDLAIVRLQLSLGNSSAAKDILERLLREDSETARMLTSDQKLTIASMFSRLGERKSVLDLLQKLGDAPASADEIQERAQLYAAAGELDLAQRMIGPVADRNDSPQSLLLAAALAEVQGRSAEAESILARLGKVVTDPLRRERLMADHSLRVQNPTRALEALGRVLALEGADGSDWSRLLAFQVLQGRQDSALETLEKGRGLGWFSKKDGNEDLSADVLRVAIGRADLRPLGAAYVRDAAQRSIAEQSIRLLDGADRSEPTATERSRLGSLAEGNPKFLELQLAVADFHLRRGEFNDAIAICRAATVAFPAAPEPYRALAYCHRAMGRSDLAGNAARDWRSRSQGLTMQADLFLAEQSTPVDAAALLAPYVQRAMDRGILGVLVLYGHAMILQGQVEQLFALLEPNLARSRVAVEAWVELAGFLALRGDAVQASLLLEREEVRANETDLDVQLQLATAWQFVAGANGSQGAREKVLGLLRSLDENSSMAARSWERLGQLHEANAGIEQAERAYRKALDVDRNSYIAMNNLAMILARSGRAKDARTLVDRLVARRPTSAEYGDTRAFVYVQTGDLETALKQYEACRVIEPAVVEWALQVLELMLKQGDREGAEKRFRVFQGVYSRDTFTPAQRDRWEDVARKLGITEGSGR